MKIRNFVIREFTISTHWKIVLSWWNETVDEMVMRRNVWVYHCHVTGNRCHLFYFLHCWIEGENARLDAFTRPFGIFNCLSFIFEHKFYGQSLLMMVNCTDSCTEGKIRLLCSRQLGKPSNQTVVSRPDKKTISFLKNLTDVILLFYCVCLMNKCLLTHLNRRKGRSNLRKGRLKSLTCNTMENSEGVEAWMQNPVESTFFTLSLCMSFYC